MTNSVIGHSLPDHDSGPSQPLPAEDTPSSSSTTPLHSQLTPDSGSSDTRRGGISASAKHGRHELQIRTNFTEEEQAQNRPIVLDSDPDAFDEDVDFSEGKGRYGHVGRFKSRAQNYTAEEEKRVVKKFDRRLTLFMAFLYMLSFLDRSSESLPAL